MLANCLICGSVLASGYRGRPRKTCSIQCQNRRRTIRRDNQIRIAHGVRALHEAIRELEPWDDMRDRVLDLLIDVRDLADEVTPENRRGDDEQENEEPAIAEPLSALGA